MLIYNSLRLDIWRGPRRSSYCLGSVLVRKASAQENEFLNFVYRDNPGQQQGKDSQNVGNGKTQKLRKVKRVSG